MQSFWFFSVVKTSKKAGYKHMQLFNSIQIFYLLSFNQYCLTWLELLKHTVAVPSKVAAGIFFFFFCTDGLYQVEPYPVWCFVLCNSVHGGMMFPFTALSVAYWFSGLWVTKIQSGAKQIRPLWQSFVQDLLIFPRSYCIVDTHNMAQSPKIGLHFDFIKPNCPTVITVLLILVVSCIST